MGHRWPLWRVRLPDPDGVYPAFWQLLNNPWRYARNRGVTNNVGSGGMVLAPNQFNPELTSLFNVLHGMGLTLTIQPM